MKKLIAVSAAVIIAAANSSPSYALAVSYTFNAGDSAVAAANVNAAFAASNEMLLPVTEERSLQI